MSVNSALVTWNIAQVALVAVHASFVLRQPAPTSAQLVLVPTHALLAVLLSPGLLAPISDPSTPITKPTRTKKKPTTAPSSPSPSTPRKAPRILAPDTPPNTPPPRTPRRRPPATPSKPLSPWRPTVTPQPYTRVRRRALAPPPKPTLPLESVLHYLDYPSLLTLRAVSKEYRAAVDAHFHRALQLTHIGSRAHGRSLAPRTWGRKLPRLTLPRSLSQASPVRALHVVNGAAPLRVLRGLEVLRVGPVQHVTHPAPTTIIMAPPVVPGSEWALAPRYEWPDLGDGVRKLVSTILYTHASLIGTEDAPHTLLPPHVSEVVLHICRSSEPFRSPTARPALSTLSPNTFLAPPTQSVNSVKPSTSSSILVVRRLHGRGPRHVLRLASNTSQPRRREGTISTVLPNEPAYDGQPKLLDDWARAIARNLPGRTFTLVGTEAWHPLWLAAGHSDGCERGTGAACQLRLRFMAEIARLARALHDWSTEETAWRIEEGVRFASVAEYRVSVGDTQYALETRW
ncbi:hypothetical protein CC85DRAFT_286597 [Cutaneotrichosporon oleaginosum]|uniref:F-box domain-containing protein n=1 Tax=Cutaneotrichosporon oleaginosum TaxID=879819 RepID=A0A0J0XJK2_9TREE|nr:uncharacterized protein CC85DRAFT_286597 [Cutaneotrichosporon oleaginosum]KLT41277.1 hypothetical protein CC85DRAFT_286597 [Cutaneotrichosporon oleaginosum]TXT14027.1 hypothetical protein COLE_00220 [Cutaneotrichosporon oleaginosum]